MAIRTAIVTPTFADLIEAGFAVEADSGITLTYFKMQAFRVAA